MEKLQVLWTLDKRPKVYLETRATPDTIYTVDNEIMFDSVDTIETVCTLKTLWAVWALQKTQTL